MPKFLLLLFGYRKAKCAQHAEIRARANGCLIARCNMRQFKGTYQFSVASRN